MAKYYVPKKRGRYTDFEVITPDIPLIDFQTGRTEYVDIRGSEIDKSEQPVAWQTAEVNNFHVDLNMPNGSEQNSQITPGKLITFLPT